MKDSRKTQVHRSEEQEEVRHQSEGTETNESQEKLLETMHHESNGLFRTLFNNLPIACFGFDREGNIQIWNRAFEELYGLRPREIVNTSLLKKLADSSERRRRKKILAAVFKGQSFYSLEWKDQRADKSICYLLANTYPVRDALGRVMMGLCACVDMSERKQAELELQRYYEHLEEMVEERTAQVHRINEQFKRELRERKQTEKALRESEEKYRLLFEHSGNPVTLFDRSGIVLMVNVIGAKNLGGAPEHFIGKSMHELFPDKAVELLERNRQVMDSGVSCGFEDAMELPSGKRWFWSNIQPLRDIDGEIHAVQIISHDITERKKMEQALIEAEERFRTLFENAMIGLYRTTADGQILMANPAMMRMLGYTSFEELARRNLEETGFEPEYPRAAFKERMENEGAVIGLESAWVRQDGNTVFIRESARVVRNEYGKPLYYEGTVEDITQRKQAEEQILLANERLQYLLSMTSPVIYTAKTSGNYEATFLSENVIRMVGYEPKEFLETPRFWIDRIHPDDVQRVVEDLPTIFEKEFHTCEYRFQRKDGTYIWIRDEMKLVRDETGKPLEIVGCWIDITERKRSEGQIKAALKEKEVLLREIHHRVKNNLQVVSSLLDLHKGEVADGGIFELLQKSQNRVKSMAIIHEQLYQSRSVSKINVSQYIRRLTNHLFQSYGVKTGTIEAKIDVTDILLDTDEAIPCGLILNELVSNSLKHAFPGDRTGEIFIGFHPQGEHQLTLTVRDNGIGFERDIDLRNIQSLGLQMVMLLVDQLKGTLECNVFDSENGRDERGTEFIIRFPTAALS
ncbi:MAG: PAS domain S-box protein [Gemmatimonadota bacterium]|nr:MAG: PAS domain S-box protein [Gemmatimonadota bacterium]